MMPIVLVRNVDKVLHNISKVTQIDVVGHVVNKRGRKAVD
jgi:hypothetical protein